MGTSGLTHIDQCKTQFIALVERYCRLGHLLPVLDDINTDNNAELADIKIILSEMAETKAELDALLRRPV